MKLHRAILLSLLLPWGLRAAINAAHLQGDQAVSDGTWQGHHSARVYYAMTLTKVSASVTGGVLFSGQASVYLQGLNDANQEETYFYPSPNIKINGNGLSAAGEIGLGDGTYSCYVGQGTGGGWVQYDSVSMQVIAPKNMALKLPVSEYDMEYQVIDVPTGVVIHTYVVKKGSYQTIGLSSNEGGSIQVVGKNSATGSTLMDRTFGAIEMGSTNTPYYQGVLSSGASPTAEMTGSVPNPRLLISTTNGTASASSYDIVQGSNAMVTATLIAGDRQAQLLQALIDKPAGNMTGSVNVTATGNQAVINDTMIDAMNGTIPSAVVSAFTSTYNSTVSSTLGTMNSTMNNTSSQALRGNVTLPESSATTAWTVSMPLGFGQHVDLDLNPLDYAIVADVLAWFKVCITFLVLAVFEWFIWDEFTTYWRTSWAVGQARGGAVIGGSGSQATALLAGGIIVAVLIGLVPVLFSMFGDRFTALGGSPGSSELSPTAGAFGLAFQVVRAAIPLTLIFACITQAFLVKKFGSQMFGAAAAAIKLCFF